MNMFENMSQLVNDTDYLLYDDFTVGLSGLCNGRVPQIGPTWVEKNAATDAPPVDGTPIFTPNWSEVTVPAGLASTGNGVAFNIVQLDETPGEVGFTFTLPDTLNIYTPTMGVWNHGMVASPGNGELHPQVASSGSTLSITTTQYLCGNPGGVIQPTWSDINSGFDTTTFTPNNEYTFRCFIDGDWNYCVILDGAGNVLAKKLTLCTGVGSLIGPWFYLETFGGWVTYKRVWARKKSSSSLNIREFLGGIDSTPIGFRDPGPAKFTSVHVGQVKPPEHIFSSVFSIGYDGNNFFDPPGVTSVANGPGVWNIAGVLSGGLGAELWLTPSLGLPYKFSIKLDNALNFSIVDNNGVPFFGKRFQKSPFLPLLPSFTNDTEAAAGGVEIGELYRNGSIVMQRVS